MGQINILTLVAILKPFTSVSQFVSTYSEKEVVLVVEWGGFVGVEKGMERDKSKNLTCIIDVCIHLYV